MSLEFEELEEPLSRVGSFIVMLTSIIMDILLIISYTLPITDKSKIVTIQYTISAMLVLMLAVTILAILCFVRPWIKRKINVFIAAIVSLVLCIVLVLTVPYMRDLGDITLFYYIFIWIDVGGIIIVFIAKRPNLGKESNKHIYQAYGAVLVFIVASVILILGIYVIFIDVSAFAGGGTFPGGFKTAYLDEHSSIEVTHAALKASGIWMIVGALVIMAAAVVRNIISMRIACGVIIGGIVIVLVGISGFFYSWQTLDSLFEKYYEDEYQAQLALAEPIVFNLGIVLVLLLMIGWFMMFYSITQYEPLEKWRTKRNHFLAASEVAIRDQKLGKAIKYLEQASIWSSKLGEEDRAVELITRISNIKEKAIKMRKAEAAEKKKKELAAAKKKAEKRAPKAPIKEGPKKPGTEEEKK